MSCQPLFSVKETWWCIRTGFAQGGVEGLSGNQQQGARAADGLHHGNSALQKTLEFMCVSQGFRDHTREYPIKAIFDSGQTLRYSVT